MTHYILGLSLGRRTAWHSSAVAPQNAPMPEPPCDRPEGRAFLHRAKLGSDLRALTEHRGGLLGRQGDHQAIAEEIGGKHISRIPEKRLVAKKAAILIDRLEARGDRMKELPALGIGPKTAALNRVPAVIKRHTEQVPLVLGIQAVKAVQEPQKGAATYCLLHSTEHRSARVQEYLGRILILIRHFQATIHPKSEKS